MSVLLFECVLCKVKIFTLLFMHALNFMHYLFDNQLLASGRKMLVTEDE